MNIYHGSEKIIKKPIWGYGNSRNDYGRGFYCTESCELSKEWACKNNTDGFANQYSFDWSDLSVLNLNSKEYNILNWLALLTKNRTYWQRNSIAEDAKTFLRDNYLIDITEYDVIVGYRADDSYFSFAQDFIMGTISLQKLSRAMRLGKLGEQIVLKSQRAFEQLEYVGSERALALEYYSKKNSRDIEARRMYLEDKRNMSKLDDIYILDIMRGRVREDELRL